jgi:arylsulfatase A-like enzyme
MISRRSALKAFAGAALATGSRKQLPNLLFILADDHAGYVLSCYGNQQARTPNLDRLAAGGARFAQHYCNYPMCTPSRQSIFTGQMPHTAGVTRLMTPLSEDKPTLARQLKKAGYQTAVFGKMHFQKPSHPGMHGFETIMTEDDVDREWKQQVHPKPVPQIIRTKPPWRPFKDPARIWLNADKLPYPCYYEDMKGTFIARQAVRHLQQQRNADQPFALWVSFMEPHSPFDFPVEDRDRYSAAQFTPPPVGPEDAPQIPIVFRDLTDADQRGIIAAYYTSVQFLDRNVGVVLDALRELNLDRRTLAVYTADHGYCLGQHGRFEKHCGYDPALRVPLLMRLPGRSRPSVITDLTEHIDLPATILDMLEVEPLPITHGRSLRPYVEGRHVAAARDYIFSEYLENEEAYIRTERFKFIYCSGKRAQQWYKTENPTPGRYVRLYDLKSDPGEFRNVAAEHPELVARFESLILERFRQTHPEATSEPQSLSIEEAIDWYVRPRDA